jgi:SAM-dependent methyltransferase
VWNLGDYDAIATEVIPELGRVLTSACDVRPEQSVLDVAAGSGNAAIEAAAAGAYVIASDLTPELFVHGRARAEDRGVDLAWHEGDAEALPYDDNTFDVVMSCVGVMYAPHHHDSADELVRVCRPGGRIGLLNWTPIGFVGQLFAALKPYAAPLLPDAQPPLLWGNEAHVRDLLGDRVTAIEVTRDALTVDAFATPEHFVDWFTATHGPTIAVFKRLMDDPDRAESLYRELIDLAQRFMTGGVMKWQYLLLTAQKT